MQKRKFSVRVKYIYDVMLADFFMSKGLACLTTGITNKGRFYWGFNYNDCQTAFIEWIEIKRKENINNV